MDTPIVYLAGPIKGHSYDTVVEWRDVATAQLMPGILALSPMRHKMHLADERRIGDAYEQQLSTASAIVARDRNDVRRCDLVLAYLLGYDDVSIGTCIEVGWADAFRKPLVVVMNEGDAHWHGMIRQIAAEVFPSLGEAAQFTRAFLLP